MNVPITRQRLVIECYHCNIVPSIEGCYTFLEQLSHKLDMRILIPPCIVRVPVTNAAEKIQVRTDDIGISGQVIWLESGCQIHTWSTHRFVTLDLFTCKPFNVEDAVEFTKNWFVAKEVKHHSTMNLLET